MKRNLFLSSILLIFFLGACRETNCPRLRISIESISGKHHSAELYPIAKSYNPSDIYAIGDHIVVVNNNKRCNLLYLYNRENLSFQGAFGLYGRASNEYSFSDRSPKPNNDSTLFLYTNYIYCSEFRISKGIAKEIDRYRIIDNLSNNVIILNDSLTFNRTLQSDRAFAIYNYRQQTKTLFFGDFPPCPINFHTHADRDNTCLSVSVYNKTRNRLAAFYESIPLVCFFDMNIYKCIFETELIDIQEQTTSLQAYYEDKNIVYFSRPVVSQDRIYVSLINSHADQIPEQTILLAIDWDGNITDKYVIDRFCPIYTVSENGVFYGITFDDDISICRTEL